MSVKSWAGKLLLALVALEVAMRILSPLVAAPSVNAQANEWPLFIEPGTTILRDPVSGAQMQGKVVVDRRTGDVFGFPTGTSAPYPVDTTNNVPPTVKAIHLGRFDLGSLKVTKRTRE